MGRAGVLAASFDLGLWTLDRVGRSTDNDYPSRAMDGGAANRDDLQGGWIVIRDRRLGRGLAALLGTPLKADIVNTPVPASGSINPLPPGEGAERSSAGEGASTDEVL